MTVSRGNSTTKRFLLLLLLLLYLSSSNAFTSYRDAEKDDVTGYVGTTREELLATRQRRTQDYGAKLQEYQNQLDRHLSGEVPLSAGDVQRLEKKIRAYSNKMEYLTSEMDERHIDRLLERERMLNEVHRERIVRRSEL
eukprot:Nitzschia sp. Nitz4//scaffold278_size24532//16724//17239//NITZ4_008378-RA/size24532-augustus-gene-0.16-mRNA-1//-1//CDS//3329545384//8399//frame0